MGLSRPRADLLRSLRADLPRRVADETFIATLAQLAATSHQQNPTPALHAHTWAKVAAVAASVALVSLGAAYVAEWLPGDPVGPASPGHTIEPASQTPTPSGEYAAEDSSLRDQENMPAPRLHRGVGGSAVARDERDGAADEDTGARDGPRTHTAEREPGAGGAVGRSGEGPVPHESDHQIPDSRGSAGDPTGEGSDDSDDREESDESGAEDQDEAEDDEEDDGIALGIDHPDEEDTDEDPDN